MDKFSLLFVVVMVILSGVVAYTGDVLGRRLGKRRHTILRLRPKHTAALLTAIAGMAMTLITIGALAFLSEDVRVWLVEGRQIQVRLQESEQALKTSKAQLDEVAGSLEEERKKLAAEQVRVRQATEQATLLRKQADALKAEVASFRKELEASRNRLKLIEAQYSALRKSAEALGKNNAEVVAQNKAISQQNLALLDEVRENEVRVAEFNGRIKQLNQNVEDLRLEQKTQLEASERLREVLQEQRRAAELALDGAKAELAQAESQIENLRTMIQQTSADFRTTPLAINVGDELARIQVRSLLSEAEARSFLGILLDNASDAAKSRGAAPQNGRGLAAGFLTMRRENAVLTPEEQFANFVREIAGKPAERLLIAQAPLNTFAGEFVPVTIVIRPNPIVYLRGAIVSEMVIDGSLDEDQIAARIAEFVGQQVSKKAVADGIIPVAGKDQSLGEIPRDTVITMVRSVRSVGRLIRLQFLATQDTRAGDPLRLDFRLR